MLPGFWDPGCHPCTLIDLVNFALAKRDSAENICMISEGYRTHTVVTGSMNFKKSGRFFSGKSCSRGFGAPGCNPSTLIEFANAALASKGSVETICMIWVGCRTQRAVTGPMISKKSAFFFGKSCSRNFGAPGCHPSSLIDNANTALARKRSVKPICRISEGYRTHGGVTGPMNLKKKNRSFFSENRAPGILGPLAVIQAL